MKEAVRIIEFYELPVQKIWDEMNFDAVMHGMQELAGVGTRYRRAPYGTLNDEQMEKLKATLQKIGLV